MHCATHGTHVVKGIKAHFLGEAADKVDCDSSAFLGKHSRTALAALDLRRLVSVGGAAQVARDDDTIVTTLGPCAAKAIPKLQPVGTIVYWNEHPTVCHTGSATLGNDGTCGECSDHAGGGACGGERWL